MKIKWTEVGGFTSLSWMIKKKVFCPNLIFKLFVVKLKEGEKKIGLESLTSLYHCRDSKKEPRF